MLNNFNRKISSKLRKVKTSIRHKSLKNHDADDIFSELSLVSEGENLCLACMNIFHEAAFPPFHSTQDEHHQAPRDCRWAGRQGCFICFTLWNAVTKLIEGETFKYISSNTFTRYGVSNSNSLAPTHVKAVEYFDPDKKEFCMWRPGDGLLPNDIPDPSGRWLLTLAFFNFGLANAMNIAQMVEDCKIIFAIEPIEVVYPELIIPSIQSYTVDSDEVWDLTVRWLENCLRSHVTCNTSNNRCPSLYPTRLLDLGATEGSLIRLLETSGSTTTGPYIALSHCWGTSQMTILTECNAVSDDRKASIPIKTFTDGIDTASLPRTFRDAIVACRKFGVRYLWIDALCIMQDSEQDWKIESAKMQHVYSNAFLTLAADASSDSTGGLFQERNPSLVSPVIVKPTWEGATSEGYVVIPRHFWKYNVSDSPLNQRAWVLQERYLSPRVLHFGETQVLWECRTQDCCETYPNGLPSVAEDLHTRFKGTEFEADGRLLRRANIDDSQKRLEGAPDNDAVDLEEEVNSGQTEQEDIEGGSRSEESGSDQGIVSKLRESNLDDVNDNVEARYDGNDNLVDEGNTGLDSKKAHRPTPNANLNGYYIWARLLEKYCRSKITKESDKLVAISGLAQEMQATLNDKYLVGLWESILPSQLLWRIESFTPETMYDNDADPRNKAKLKAKTLTDQKKQADPVGARPSYCRAPSWSWAAIEGPIATSRPSRSGSLISITPWSIGDGIETIEPAILVVEGDLHIGRVQYYPHINHWGVAINKRGKRVKPSTKRNTGATSDPMFFLDCKEEWEMDSCPVGRYAPALAYPDTTPPQGGVTVMCMPVARRYRTKALQAEEGATDREKVSGLMLRPHPDPGGMRGVYQRIGVFDTLPVSSAEDGGRVLDFGEEYCYSDDNKELFSDGPAGWSEIVLLN